MLIKNQTTITIIPEGVVGKLYVAKDNSYSHDLTNHPTSGGWNGGVCGHTFVLTCEPYMKQVHEGFDLEHFGPCNRMVVQGVDPITGWTYEMMYHPGWIVE